MTSSNARNWYSNATDAEMEEYTAREQARHDEEQEWIRQWMGFNELRDFAPASPLEDDNGDEMDEYTRRGVMMIDGLSHPGSPPRYGVMGNDFDVISLDRSAIGTSGGLTGGRGITGLQVQLPDDTTTGTGQAGLLYSPVRAFGDMTIRGTDGMFNEEPSNETLEFGPEMCIQNESTEEERSSLGNHEASIEVLSEAQTMYPNSHRPFHLIPPVKISPCSRPPSPRLPLNCDAKSEDIPPTAGPEPSAVNQLRKRHFSEAAAIHAHSKENGTSGSFHGLLPIEDSPSDSYQPPQEANPSRIIRRASSRLKKRPHIPAIDGKPTSGCFICPDPRVYTEGQRIRLDELPTELLIEVFTYACSSLPATSKYNCEHMKAKAGQTEYGLLRRSTTNGILSGREGQQMRAEFLDQPPTHDTRGASAAKPTYTLGRRLRLLQARTICAIQRTCKHFNDILTAQPMVDNKLWREATIACWGHLPKTLAEVQGWDKSSQTCWRNVFGVFMRSDNGLFRKKGAGGGAGGVEGFGGRKGFTGAVLWEEEKELRRMESLAEEYETYSTAGDIGKGKGKEVEVHQQMGYDPAIQKPRRKLLLICTQPGPDRFAVKTMPGPDQGYEIGMVLQNGEHVFTRLDQYGNFGLTKGVLPTGLRRSKKGHFPPDIYMVIGDRFRLVKVAMGPIQEDYFTGLFYYTSREDHQNPSPQGNLDQTVMWSLRCVPEYVTDHRASVARCESLDGFLVFNIFASRDGFIQGLDKPTEDPRVFCVLATGHPGCNSADSEEGGLVSRRRRTRHGANNSTTPNGSRLSAKQRGKLPSRDSPPTARTIFRWQRTFVHPNADAYPPSQGLHYRICNLKLNRTHAAILIRWNIHSKVSYEEFVDREFHILDLRTGTTTRVLQFPNFHWDFRHHDMTIEYNIMRHYKMKRMYNVRHAGNRATRIHDDEFTLDDNGKLISGSHDYCIWVWDLKAEYDEDKQSGRVFNPIRNDAGVDDPFQVLDDFYWDGKKQDGDNGYQWNTNNERAGWWVKTPNQVLCFWHSVAISKDGKWFAAVRAGRMFVWNLEDITQVHGFTCAQGTYSPPTLGTTIGDDKSSGRPKLQGSQNFTSSTSLPAVESRYLGKLINPRLEKRLRHWFVWNKLIPEQGLWMLYDDGKVVYLNRDDILDACGLAREGKQWEFQRHDFGDLDGDDDDDEEEEGEEEDGYCSNDDEYAGDYMDEDLISNVWEDDLQDGHEDDWTYDDQELVLNDDHATEVDFGSSALNNDGEGLHTEGDDRYLPETPEGGIHRPSTACSIPGIHSRTGSWDLQRQHQTQQPQQQQQYLSPLTNPRRIRKRRRTSGSYCSGTASNRSSFNIFDGPSSSSGFASASGTSNGNAQGNLVFDDFDVRVNGIDIDIDLDIDLDLNIDGDEGLMGGGGEVFLFENELPEAKTWEEMDPEGWLRMKSQAGEAAENGEVWHSDGN
ncbi:hypothetical protein DFH27DRAFT_107914 [Peziza echinospora]|nr:hypothetical protein DFH27DRAFT_107914 [Peziza echinospora]